MGVIHYTSVSALSCAHGNEASGFTNQECSEKLLDPPLTCYVSTTHFLNSNHGAVELQNLTILHVAGAIYPANIYCTVGGLRATFWYKMKPYFRYNNRLISVR